eukprot:m.434721 g.434721  ORF g.434721 m.434721 type:complete len:272 (+) comp17756_c0_seq1:3056-3871(+)
MADDWEDDDWETAEAAPVPTSSGVKNLDDEEEEEEPEAPAINPNSKYAGMKIEDLVKELERRDTEEAKANAAPKELSAKEKRRKRKEAEEKERERRRQEEAMTAEERAESEQEKFARKLEQQRLVEDADLEIAMDLMGVADEDVAEGAAAGGSASEVTLIEAMAPKTEADFQQFSNAIVAKVTKYNKSIFYPQFVADSVREMCLDLKPEEIKKVNSTLTILMNDKNKALLSKPKKKGKGGKLGGGGTKSFAKEALGGVEGGGDYDDLDDFM